MNVILTRQECRTRDKSENTPFALVCEVKIIKDDGDLLCSGTVDAMYNPQKGFDECEGQLLWRVQDFVDLSIAKHKFLESSEVNALIENVEKKVKI